MILDGGRPIAVEGDRDRIGRGAWARLFASSVVGDESSPVAERGRARARAGDVHTVDVAEGEISAEVGGCVVRLRAETVPRRIWSAVARSARSDPERAGVEGREQSVHLEHSMRFEWDEPLVPDRAGLRKSCTCDEDGMCEHLAAVAYVVADRIDAEPSLLLTWRGCTAVPTEESAPSTTAAAPPEDAWETGELPPGRDPRPLPAGAVLKSLGPSGIRAGVGDLADALQRAYDAFARS